MTFKDRQDAGQQLAAKLSKYKNKADVIVIGLPRGGVVTAAEVAKELKVPLDIIVPRKIGAPGNPEFAIGAITEDGEGIINQDTVAMYGIPQDYIDSTIAEEKKEAERRLKSYRGDRLPLKLEGKTVLLVDDGVATGSTMRAAVASAKAKKAKKVVVAIPVIAADTVSTIEAESDEVIYVDAPEWFGAVGRFYEEFDQTEDEEVIEILSNSP